MGWNDVTREASSSDKSYSHTQISMYRRCPRQWEFRYVKGKKQAPNASLLLGTTVHKSIEENYKTKFKTRRAANRSKVMDVYGQAFENGKSGIDFEGRNKGEVKDTGYAMAGAHYDDLAPSVQPIKEPEQKFELRMPGVSKSIIGYKDVVANVTGIGLAIMDNKTGKRKKAQFDVDLDDQLTMYALDEKLKTNKILKVGFDVMIAKKASVETQRVMTVRGPDRFDDLIKTVQAVDRGIKAGAFPPTSNGTICSWCGYANICPTAKAARAGRDVLQGTNAWD